MSRVIATTVAGITIPTQVFLALMSSAILVRELNLPELGNWFLLMSLLPIMGVLELSAPLILLKQFSETKPSIKLVVEYLIKITFTVIVLQVLAMLVIKLIVDKFAMEILYFGVGVIFRTVANFLIVFPYSQGGVVKEKVFRFSSVSIFPIMILIYYFSNGDMPVNSIYCMWVVSSFLIAVLAAFFFYQVRDLIVPCEYEEANFVFDFRASLKLILVSVPGLFIFNLSIYYLDAYSEGVDVVIYGLFLQLVNVYYVANNVVPSIVSPMFIKRFSDGGAGGYVSNVIVFSTFLSVSAIAVLIGFGSEILDFAFDSKIERVQLDILVHLVSIVILVEGIQVVMTYFSMVTGKYNFYVPSLFSAGIISCLSYILIPLYGYVGLVSSIVFSQLVTCFPFNIILASKWLGVDLRLVSVCCFLLLFFTLSTMIVNYYSHEVIMYSIPLILIAATVGMLITIRRAYYEH